MKNSILLLLAGLAITFASYAQEEVQVKIIKEIHGETTVIDTTYQAKGDIDVHVMLEDLGIDVNEAGETSLTKTIKIVLDSSGSACTKMRMPDVHSGCDDLNRIEISMDSLRLYLDEVADAGQIHSVVTIDASHKPRILKASELEELDELFDDKDGEKKVVLKTVCLEKKPDDCLPEALQKKAGAEDLEVLEFELYPNPSDGNLNVSFDLMNSDKVVIEVFDTKGNKLYSEKMKGNTGKYHKEIQLDEAVSGTCYVRITQSGKSATKKIIVK